MAERNPPLFMDVNDVYSGDELALPYRDILTEGIVGSGSLAVSAGAGNTVNIAAGAAWVLGDTDPNFQPNYRVYNDAVVNKGINPDPTNPRKVRVVAQITDEGFSGTGRNWAITAIHGTPAGSPVDPGLPASALDLATILVPAAAASSAAYTFTDARVQYAIAEAAFGAWQTFVPIWTASGTAPALGNGTLTGRYKKIGKTVHFIIEWVAGSTTTFGTGNYSFQLPIASATPGNVPIGIAWAYAGGNVNVAAAIIATATTLNIQYGAAWPTGVQTIYTNTTPFGWGSGNFIRLSGTYEAS